MGEGLFRMEGGGEYEVFSAGTKPSRVRPEAVAVMREIGEDISGHRSKSVDEFSSQTFDFVVTVCDKARDACPVFIGASRIRRRSKAVRPNDGRRFPASATRSMRV
jgi:arsenate reductase